MNLLKRYFNRKITMLGRAGIVYKDGGIKYFIDSEVLFRPPSDIVIWKRSVKFYESDQPMDAEQQEVIARKIESELMSMGMIVEFDDVA